MKELLKPADIAPMLGVTTARVYQLLSEGVLPFVRIGRGVRIPKAAWDTWLAHQNEEAWSATAKKDQPNKEV